MLPEKFKSYTDLTGTDGLPLGDLNHYGLPTGIENGGDITPAEFVLEQNYPNPFNPTTTISYQLNKNGNVQLTVSNVLGEKVKTLVNEIKQPGRYETLFDASSVASGIYFYRLQAEDYIETHKMVLLR